MSRLPHHSEIAPGIILQDEREVRLVFHVLHDRFDDRDLAVKRDVHHVGALLRPDAHPVAHFQRDPRDRHLRDLVSRD